MLTTIVSIAIAASTTGLVLWERDRHLRRLVRILRDLRDRASDEFLVYRPLPEADLDASWLLRAARNDQVALEARGFTVLGDVVAQSVGMLPHQLLRVLNDADATTFAYLTTSLEPDSKPSVSLESYTGDESWTTLQYKPPVPVLAQTPFDHVEGVPPELGLDALLSKHRSSVGLGGSTAPALVHCATLAAMCAELTRWHRRRVRWRREQPSDALLEADLRGVLGRTYEKLAARVTVRLSAPLPRARLRRRQ